MNFETENIEFKAKFTEGIYKEVIAFANTEGGFIYVGIDNNGKVAGIKNIDEEYTRITNGIRDAILPDVTMFVHYSIQDNNVVQIAVNEGTNKPYYLKSKGPKPSGVYVRQGASSVPASQEQIRKMIKETDGDNYEDMQSPLQDLTFNSAKSVFKKCGVEFGKEKYRALGMIREGVYTNLALLLSDQCRHTTKIAVFNDVSCTEFRDSKEFGGSIFKQFEDAVNYLALCNKTASTIKGMYRTDKKDYPEEAIRESLLNALIHRDYGFSGSIIVNINDNKAEFISLGGLMPGLSTEDIRIGVSQPRNKKLAEVFHRLHFIECYGTGIRRIFQLYENCPSQPLIETTPGAFKITLPNMNESSPELSKKPITDQMNKVISYIKENGSATDAEIEQLLDIKHTRAYILTKQMCEQKLIESVGRGKTKNYLLK